MAQAIGLAAPSITDGDVEAVVTVLRSGWLTSGAECDALEAELAAYLDIPHVVALSSCTAGLEIAMAHLGLAPGARVGVPTWTFPASAFAAVHQGASVVLLDVDPGTLNVAPDAVAAALDDGLDAVVVVHFGGNPVDAAVLDACAGRAVPVVEDAAHALGAVDQRGRVAGAGTAGAAFSFYATKNLTSGEGGALATDDADLAEFARAYRLHGLTGSASAAWDPEAGVDLLGPGVKANLPDLLAALARSQLRRFEDSQRRRRALVHRYRARLDLVERVEVIPVGGSEGSADHLLTVVLDPDVSRRAVIDALAAARIGTGVHFRPLHHYEWFQRHATMGPTGTVVADRLAGAALSLPLHPDLSDADVDRVCDVLEQALQ